MESLQMLKYDGKEPLHKYLEKLEKFKANLLQNDYMLMLEFLNKLLNTQNKSLADFKNVPEWKIFKNEQKKPKTINYYVEKFENKYDINLNKGEDFNLVSYLTKILEIIGYKMYKRTINNKFYYTIKLK